MKTVTVTENAMERLEERFNRFRNENTFWHHDQDGTMAEFDRRFEEAVTKIRGQLGATLPLVINGEERTTGSTFTMTSPTDDDLIVGHYAAGTKQDVRGALDAAKDGFASWRKVPWKERAAMLEKAADLYVKNFYELCAVMCFETGKTRYEASIDVDEAIDFLRFYALSMREYNGFAMTMGKPVPNETCTSVRKPWGVFAVFCPFNFPVAITTGMTVGALVTGNTVLLKPSMKGCLAGWWCFKLLREAGIPGEALHFLTGPDEQVSVEMMENPGIDGIAFTGSKKIGFKAMKNILEHGKPKPMIAEMGGKNAVIVTKNADLDKAVEGVFKSAFGFSGQKCSACSRVYVESAVADDFLDRLTKLTEAARVGEPWMKENYMGPVTDPRKIGLMDEVVAEVKKDGGKVLTGGTRAKDGGHYLRPTVVTGLALDHRVFREEFFMPFVAVAKIDSLEQGIKEYNKAQYGLTAGIMSEDADEVKTFFDTVQAGVLYANRSAGASTAAVVNGQSFVGWKNSGNTGNGAGGRYYLMQFTHEQSHTVVE